MNKCITFLWFLHQVCTMIFCHLFSSALLMSFSIYLWSEFFFSFRATFCFTNPDYRLIRMTSPPQINPDYRGFTVVLCGLDNTRDYPVDPHGPQFEKWWSRAEPLSQRAQSLQLCYVFVVNGLYFINRKFNCAVQCF
jgi:hypothetical protein